MVLYDNSITNRTVVQNSTSPIKLRLGLMGSWYGLRGDWAWGPALQLGTQLSERNELVIDAGLAAGLDSGRESGLLVHLGVAHYLDDNVGLTAGVHSTSIYGSPNNGQIDGDYLGLSVGFVVRTDRFRAEFSPIIGGLRDGLDPNDTKLAMGITSSLFVGF